MAWEDLATDWGGRVLDAAIAYKVTQPYEVKKLQLQALGDAGYYLEGQPNGQTKLAPRNAFGVPPGVLLIGAGLLLVYLLKD